MSTDRELRKGSAETLILALLEERDRHGYEIAKLIDERSDGAITFHVASLYPTLYRLERRGLISGRWVEQSGMRRRRLVASVRACSTSGSGFCSPKDAIRAGLIGSIDQKADLRKVRSGDANGIACRVPGLSVCWTEGLFATDIGKRCATYPANLCPSSVPAEPSALLNPAWTVSLRQAFFCAAS